MTRKDYQLTEAEEASRIRYLAETLAEYRAQGKTGPVLAYIRRDLAQASSETIHRACDGASEAVRKILAECHVK